MEIRYFSDLHTEFGKFDYVPIPGDKARTLVLAGDIGVGTTHLETVERLCQEFKHVVMVHGNHEFYDNEVYEVRKAWEKIQSFSIPNLHVLDDSVVCLDGVRFVGGTLWTDMMNEDYHTIQIAAKNMSDYHVCKIEKTIYGHLDIYALHPNDTIKLHNITKQFIIDVLLEEYSGKTVVVTHHLPLGACIPKKYKNSTLSGAYYSNLEEIFEKYQFSAWIHGHTHDRVYLDDVYGKKVRCNPRGYYGLELNRDFDPYALLVV